MKNEQERLKIAQLIYSGLYKTKGGAASDFYKSVLADITAEGMFTPQEVLSNGELTKLVEIPDEELYWYLNAMHKHADKSQLENASGLWNPLKYFSDVEVRNVQTYQRVTQNKSLRMLENPVQLAPNQWSIPMSVAQIARMSNAGMIRADVNLQRESRVVNKKRSGKDESFRIVKIDAERVNTISNLIKEGKFFFNTIRLNLLDNDDEENCLVIAKDALVLPENADIIVPDGNHRRAACQQAYYTATDEQKKALENVYFNVIFTNLPGAEVRKLINQEWTMSPIPKAQKEFMKVNNENDVIDRFKKSADLELFLQNHIASTYSASNGFIEIRTLSESVRECYDASLYSTASKRMEIAAWLVEFYNYVYELYEDEFAKPYSWCRKRLAPVGFIFVSSKYFGTTGWKELVPEWTPVFEEVLAEASTSTSTKNFLYKLKKAGVDNV